MIKEGDISEPRNPVIIRAYRMINLAEDAGSGFHKIFANWEKAGFVTPEIVSNMRENLFKIVFRFELKSGAGLETQKGTVGIKTDETAAKSKTGEKTGEKMIELFRRNPEITINELSQEIGITDKGVEWQIAKLKEKGILKRKGPPKGGHWEVVENGGK